MSIVATITVTSSGFIWLIRHGKNINSCMKMGLHVNQTRATQRNLVDSGPEKAQNSSLNNVKLLSKFQIRKYFTNKYSGAKGINFVTNQWQKCSLRYLYGLTFGHRILYNLLRIKNAVIKLTFNNNMTTGHWAHLDNCIFSHGRGCTCWINFLTYTFVNN